MGEMWHWLIHFLFLIVFVLLAIDGLTLCWVRRVYQLAYKINYRLGGWIIFFDLDGLKKINDTLGHEQGDVILRRAAEIFISVSKGRCFRYGGDEFVILTFSQNREKGEKMLEKIKSKTQGIISFSYGLGKTEQEADKNMFQMKKKKKNKPENSI